MPVPRRERAWRFCLLSLVLSTVAQAEPFHGFVYELGAGRKNPLFSLKRTEAREPDGTRVIEGTYVALDPSGGVVGKDALHELVKIRNHRILKVIQEQNQVQAWGTLEPRGAQVRFEWVDAKHEMHTGDEENVPNLIVGSTSVDYLREHWGDLLEGKGLDVRFAVLDRQETVGFRFVVSHREKRAGKELVHVLMKPTSIFVQLVVKPLELVFERKNVRLLELRGRVGLKRREGNAWKDFEAEMVYQYSEDVPVPASQPRR